MAPLGHTVLQAPQPTHRCGSTTTPPPCPAGAPGAGAPGTGPRFLPVRLPFRLASLRMARAEHTSMQAVQPVCWLRLWAHRLWRYWKKRGFSKSPTRSRRSSTAAISRRSSLPAWM